MLRLLLPDSLSTATLLIFGVVDMAVPVWAEFRSRSPWHPGHITERYGLFTLIVLGECVAGATVAVRAAIGEHGLSAGLLLLAAGALVLVFAMWWSYFKHDSTRRLADSLPTALFWGYGHYFIFAAVAALGAGLEVAADAIEHAPEATPALAGWAVTIPVAVFIVVGSIIQSRAGEFEYLPWPTALAAAALILLAGALAPTLTIEGTVLATAALLVLLLAANLRTAHRRTANPVLKSEA